MTETETNILNKIDLNLNLRNEIKKLKKELNAVILAHYYQESEIQDLADFIGDSLQLAQNAEKTNADVIVFAGVHFMAETAKILNPNKLVLLPDLNAGCSLAEGCPADLLKKFKDQNPGHILISYINCTADVKAISDIICTSSNAVKIVEQIPKETGIIFAPDKNLGKWVMKKTGREMKLWQGACIVHETFSAKKIFELKQKHPKAILIAHPECEEHILSKAEFIGSTSALLNFVITNENSEFIVATEPGIIHQMELKAPGKKFIPAPPESSCACNDCPYMKLNTLEKLYLCMRDKKPEITLDEEIRKKAFLSLKKMLEMSK
ncbi:MAG TPA: quinolinate synthase [Bacteroidetes bacterium]|nr:quinolinate synthase NadA [Ignavibacteria bacterium]HCA43352.1 quinolinate synthase [Bacteroidota bacterium]HCN36499.1 quinolinate synthase [Bacteroidota bacterium]